MIHPFDVLLISTFSDVESGKNLIGSSRQFATIANRRSWRDGITGVDAVSGEAVLWELVSAEACLARRD